MSSGDAEQQVAAAAAAADAPADAPAPEQPGHSASETAPVKALLDLYERGNKTNFSSHSIVEEEVRILRGFVRSKKSIFEQLSTTTAAGHGASSSNHHLKPTSAHAHAARKWEKPAPPLSVTISQPPPMFNSKDSPNERIVRPSAVKLHQRNKSQEALVSIKEPAAPAVVKEEEEEEVGEAVAGRQPSAGEAQPVILEVPRVTATAASARTESEVSVSSLESDASSSLAGPVVEIRLQDDSQVSGRKVSTDDGGFVRPPLKPRFSVARLVVEPKPAEESPLSPGYLEAIERMKQTTLTQENKEVTRLQRRLTMALSSSPEHSEQKLQALIMDALERSEDEERPLLHAVRAKVDYTPVPAAAASAAAEEDGEEPTEPAVPPSPAPHLDLPVLKGDVFGVIQDLGEHLKVRTIDGEIGLVPKAVLEEAPLESFVPQPPSPTASEALDFDERSWARQVGEAVAGALPREERSRQEAIYELQSTEEAFFADLDGVVQHFVNPMREAVGAAVDGEAALTEEEFERIFVNLREILAFSERFLARLRKDREEQGPVIRDIGRTLEDEILNFRVYAPFCAHLKRALGVLAAKRQDPAFMALFDGCQRRFNRNLNLESFLLKPMQRVTKLPLLVKGIIKYTTEAHDDFLSLQTVQAKTDEVAWYVNAECGKVDERDRLDQLQEQLARDLAADLGPGFLRGANRTLLREGPLQRVSPDVKLRGFLFSDLVLLAREDKDRRFRLYAKPTLLWLCEVQDVEQAPEKKHTAKRGSRVLAIRPGLSGGASGRASPLGVVAADQAAANNGGGTTPNSAGGWDTGEFNRNFALNDQGAGVMYDLRAPSPREKILWLEDIGIAIKRLRHDLVIFMRLLELKDGRSEAVDAACCLTYGGQYMVGASEGLYTARVSPAAPLSKHGAFKKRVAQLQIVEQIGKLVLLEGKSSSVRSYPLSMLEEGGAANTFVQRLDETSSTTIFRAGLVGDQVMLACASSSKLLLYRHLEGEQIFSRTVELALPATPCRSLEFIGSTLYLALGARFYTLDMASQRLQEVLLSESALGFGMNEPVAVKAMGLGDDDEVLLCYSDAGIWIRGSAHANSTMHWSSTAKAFACSGPYLFVFTANYVEIWDWSRGRLMQAIKAPNIRPLNSYSSALRQEHDRVESCLVAVSYLLQPHPHLCRLEVMS